MKMRWWSILMAVALAPAVSAGAVDPRSETAATGVPDALARSAEPSRPAQVRGTRDIVVDLRKRQFIVLTTPAKHRKVVALLQRLVADDKPAGAAVVMPPKTQRGPSATYKYDGENVINVIRDLAREANMNVIIRGPHVHQRVDLTFKGVPARDLLKLVLDIHNFNYQMSPNGETLVVFTGRMHRTMEAHTIPAKVTIPLDELAGVVQTSVLDVDEPEGAPENGGGFPGAPGGAAGGFIGEVGVPMAVPGSMGGVPGQPEAPPVPPAGPPPMLKDGGVVGGSPDVPVAPASPAPVAP